MALMIRHPAPCFYCQKLIARGQGYLQRTNGKWFAHCMPCYNKKKKASAPEVAAYRKANPDAGMHDAKRAVEHRHDMVEMNCGSNPHIWACVSCRRYVPSPHPSLSHEEVDALIEFILVARESFQTRRMNRQNKEKSFMQIEVKITGNTPADVLGKLRLAVGAWSGEAETEEEIETETKPKRARKTKAVETIEVADDEPVEEEMLASDDEPTEEEETLDFDADADDEPVEEEEAEEPPPAKKATKKTKLTDKDVNAACLAHAKSPKNKGGRKATLAILAKKFGVKSISDLKADQYEAVIKALAV